MPQPLTDAINALTTYANTVTGASDTTLSDAVATLAAGYGGGGISIDDLANGTQPTGDLVITATTIVNNAFANKNLITSIWAPNATSLGANAVNACTGLKQVYIGGVDSTIGQYAIRSCSALKSVRFPKAKSNFNFGGYGLQNCSSLELVDIGKTTQINFNNMPTCPLNIIIIRNTGGVVNLQSGTALDNSTAFKNGGTGGTVYVPSSLVSSYKTTGNWATYFGYGTMTFTALEGSPYEQPDFVYQV